MSDLFFLQEALMEAKIAESLGEVPVGCVIVRDGIIISRGYNKRENEIDPSSHAEINAIRNACSKINTWRLNGCILYVTLEPCPMCLGAIQQSRISKVIYGAKDPKGGALSLGYSLHEDKRLNHRFEVIYHPMNECSAILTHFFRKLRE